MLFQIIYCSSGLVRLEVKGHFDLENCSFDFLNLLPKCSLGIDLSVCKIFLGMETTCPDSITSVYLDSRKPYKMHHMLTYT